MIDFWQGRTPREQILLALSGLILLIVFVGLLMIRPVMGYHSAAVRAQSAAAQDLDSVARGAALIGQPHNQTMSNRQMFDRNSVFTTARQQGLDISRIQPVSNGALKIWFNDTSAEAFYTFTQMLTQTYNVLVDEVQISRQNNGQISVQITLRSMGG